MEEIEDWRAKIDAVDEKLVELLNRRAGFVVEIGRIKRTLGEPIYAPDREEAILRRVLELNKGPLSCDALQRLFERIIDESRRLEWGENERGEVTKTAEVSGDGSPV